MKWVIQLALIGIVFQLGSTNPPPPAPPANTAKILQNISKCNVDISKRNVIEISDCSEPLVLNSESFSNIINKDDIDVVNIRYTYIDRIYNDAFVHFENLNDVVISEARIKNIESNVFEGIERLQITNSQFEIVPTLNSKILVEFICNNCNLTEVPILDNLINLEYLNLTNNVIKSIDLHTFSKLENLDEVSLVNNELSSIPAELFKTNLEFTRLFLDGNPLKTIHLNPVSLETLSLESCQLKVFDEISSKGLFEVTTLNLKNNDISNLTANSFSSMPNLEEIDLSDNNLGLLDPKIFRKNLEMTKIVLDNNLIKTLPNFFIQQADGAFSVRIFSCNNCGLNKISNQVFANMPQMASLLLARNNLESLDNVFSNLIELEILDLSSNQIRMIDTNAFSNNRLLRVINLSGNPLKSLDPILFKENNALKTLDVRCTQLTNLWSTHNTILPSLEYLYASDNDITDLTIDDVKVTKNLRIIDLTDNEFASAPSSDRCELISQLRNVKSVKYEDKSASMDDIPNYQSLSWEELFNVSCKDFIIKTTTQLKITTEPDDERDSFFYDDMDLKGDDISEIENDDDDNDLYDDSYYNDDEEKKIAIEQVEESFRATDILSLTAAFILTAVIVLTAAVSITLCILKRNNNSYTKNLPHFKLPLWNDAQFNQKKHSGSVYRPLSEDLSGPKTPKFSRYEFLATPTVHTTNNS